MKAALTFKKVDIDVDLRTLNDVVTGYDHTMVIAADNKVYAWGCYTSEDKHHFTPVHVPFFDKYNILKLCSS